MRINSIGIKQTFMGQNVQKSSEQDKQALDEIMSYFDKEESFIEILKRMNANESLKQETPYMYRLGSYELYVGSSFNIGETEENLRLLNKHKVKSAPRLVASKQTKNKKYQIIAIQSQERSQDYEKHKDSIPAGERRNFYEELKNFSLKTRLYNPLIIEGFKNWRIDSKGKICIEDWSTLERFENHRELQSYIDKLGKMCELTFS